MSSRITIKSHPGAGAGGLIAIIAGVVMILAGGATWGLVATQLANERITVSQDAPFFQGALVQDPFTAFSQAEAINKHSLEMSGNRTYSEIPADDPVRADVMNASFLRSSLFTSVVSFGVALLVIGAGLLFILIGWAIRRMTLSHPIVVETDSDLPVQVENTKGKVLTPIPASSERAEPHIPVAAESLDARAASDTPLTDSPLADSAVGASSLSTQAVSGTPVVEPEVVESAEGAPAVVDQSAVDLDGSVSGHDTQLSGTPDGASPVADSRIAPVFTPITVPKAYSQANSDETDVASASPLDGPETDRVVYDPAVHGPAVSTPIVSTSSPQDVDSSSPVASDSPVAPGSPVASDAPFAQPDADSKSLPSFDELIAQDGGGPLRLSRSERLLAESKNRRDQDIERTGLTGTIPIVGASGPVSPNQSAPVASPFEPISASASSPSKANQNDFDVDPNQNTADDSTDAVQEGFDYNNRAQGWQSPQDRLK